MAAKLILEQQAAGIRRCVYLVAVAAALGGVSTAMVLLRDLAGGGGVKL